MKGFILLHKQIMDWEWYGDINTSTLFIHCLLKANYTDKRWRGKLIKRGQFVTSINKLSLELELSDKQIRLTLDKLVDSGEILKKTTSKNTTITVVRYDYYQDYKRFVKNNRDKQNDARKTNKSHTKVIQMSTTKEGKEKDKNNKETKEERSAHIFLKENINQKT